MRKHPSLQNKTEMLYMRHSKLVHTKLLQFLIWRKSRNWRSGLERKSRYNFKWNWCKHCQLIFSITNGNSWLLLSFTTVWKAILNVYRGKWQKSCIFQLLKNTVFSLYRCRHFVFTSIDKTSFDFSSTLQNAFALHIVTFLLSSHIDPHFILQVKASQPLCNHTDCLCKDRDDLNRLHDWPTFTL